MAITNMDNGETRTIDLAKITTNVGEQKDLVLKIFDNLTQKPKVVLWENQSQKLQLLQTSLKHIN